MTICPNCKIDKTSNSFEVIKVKPLLRRQTCIRCTEYLEVEHNNRIELRNKGELDPATLPTKECPKCKQVKDVTEFPFNPDENLNPSICNDCIDALYNVKAAIYRARAKAKNGNRIRAQNYISNLIKDGKFIRKPCQHITGHNEDDSPITCACPKTISVFPDCLKPKEVLFLCRTHAKEFQENTPSLNDW